MSVMLHGCALICDTLFVQIFLDGVDIRKFDLVWLREQLSLVSQEPHLFTGSIRDNIAYGKSNASEEEIREAAAAANALEFIQAAPAGLDTKVGPSCCLAMHTSIPVITKTAKISDLQVRSTTSDALSRLVGDRQV